MPKILFAASECTPFIKTGGLADVVGSLPIALSKGNADVRVILPMYRIMPEEWKRKMEHVCSFTVRFGWEDIFCGIEQIRYQGVTFYFVDNQEYFSPDNIYGDGVAEGLRFAYFCRAVLESLPQLGFFPDILHCNDWQTGLIPVLLRMQYAGNPSYDAVRTVFTIHNLKYQGLFGWQPIAGRLGLNGTLFTSEMLEYYGMLNCLKGGIVFSDKITTVSPTYAGEIQSSYFGEGLDGVLRMRAHDLSGILNGIDCEFYNPETDPYIAAHFSADHPDGKAECKTALQRECGFPEDPSIPIIGMISRLTPQKGLDLIECVLGDIMRQNVQLVFLGKGDQHFVDFLNWANWRYPGRIYSCIRLDEPFAHRIYAGSDLFLMPSQFEPCGLSQMISFRYGTVPIVRETGGLKDSVIPYNMYTDSGTGFSFANYNAHEMLFTIERAVSYYQNDPEMWHRLVERGMHADFSWTASAQDYMSLYGSLLPAGKEPAAKAKPRTRKPASKRIRV